MMTKLPEEMESKAEIEAAKSNDRKRILRATSWTSMSYVVGNVLRLVSNLVLARLLFPEAFALLALAALLTQGLKMFSDIGIGPSIIQSRFGEETAFLNTAWTMQVIRGGWLFIVACGLAYPFAHFYNTPDLLWIVPVSAFPSIISGFNSTALFTLNRQLAMARITMLNLGESVVKLVVTIAWAFIYPSVWAILGGIIASRVFYTAASHLLLPSHRHRLTWNRDAAKELFSFGSWVFLSTAVTFFADQTDRLMLGKLIPLDLLGVYSIALMFSRLPIEICSTVMGQVFFPVMASIARTEPSRLAEVLTQSRRMTLTIGAAATVGLMALSPWFFHLAYDQRYQAAVWMAPLLGFAMWFGILQASCDRTLLALGDTRSLFLSNLANFVVTIISCLIGFWILGMPGFIVGFGLGNLAGHAVIALALAQRSLLKVRLDFGYSAIVVAMGIIGAWLPANLSMNIATKEGTFRLVLQGLVAAVAGGTIAKTALSLIRKH